MAGNIKGITIEFRGDTTKLDKAIRQINSETRSLDRELKNIDKALKFNPSNIDLWRQKQENLTDKINATNEKLKLLKDTQKKVDSGEIEMTAQEYRELQREIIECESKVKTFQGQLKKLGNIKLQAIGSQFQEVGAKIENAGQKMMGLSAAAGVVTASIGALAYKSGVVADDLNTLSKVTGIGTDKLQEYSVAADLVDVSTESIAKSNTRLKKSMLSAQDGAGTQAEAFNALGVSVTNSDGSLRDSNEVFQDVISALGTMTNETERDALAQQLMGRSAAELNPLIEDGGETYKRVSEIMSKYGLDFVDQETLDKANEFNDQLDTMKAIGTVALQTVGTQLAGYLAPALEKVVGWIGNLANWLSNLSPQVLTVIGVVGAVVAGLAPLLITIGKISTGVGALIKVFGMMPAALGPIGLIIAGVVAAGVILYKNWDTIKAKAIAFKNKVVSVFNDFKSKVTAQFNAIKTAIVTPIQNAIDKIKAIIDKVKGWFPIKIGKIFSGIKLPHFKLSGEFSLKNKTVPKLSIDWYKTGGIFDSPSIIGVGESGSEAVVPLDKLWDKLDNIANASGGVVVNVYGSDNMSVDDLAKAVEQKLIQMQKRRTMAWV